jgi:hypothetical protein
MNSAAVFFQITRFGVPYAAGHYRSDGTLVQVFPVKQIFKDKGAWCKAWSIFGDEQVMTYFRRPLAVLRR